MPVPLFDNATPLAALKDELRIAIDRVLDSGRYILGPEVLAFEAEFAAYVGAAHAIGVANGTDALTIALRAPAPLGPSKPTTSPRLTSALTPRTKAVLAVDLFGNVAPIGEIEALGVPVLEDAAQAAGSLGPSGRPGSLGTAATFSFYPSKNLGAFGDGGAITTNDDGIAERVRALRFHGSRDKQTFEEVGYNSRLDELQAAILRVQLPHLDDWAAGRRTGAQHYEDSGLDELVSLPAATAGSQPAWHLYVIRSGRADELEAALRASGIEARSYYRVSTHLQPAFAVALELRDRIGLGIRLCEKKVTRWQSCVPLFTEVYSLPGFTLLRS